jgi:sugar transferase (PEP-CTERM system associated)
MRFISPSRRWLLFFGDTALIIAASYLSLLIRSGKFYPVLSVHTGASVFTLFLYVVMFYIFDLYNLYRSFFVRDTLLRALAAVGAAGMFSSFLFYSLPSWKYGRGILLIQMAAVLVLTIIWRRFFALLFHMSVEKENVLILGAGSCGKEISRLLEGKLSPYRVVGFLDDDPLKKGKQLNDITILDAINRLPELAAEQKIKTAIFAITGNIPAELMKQLGSFRLNGIKILPMYNIYEKLAMRIPIRYINDTWFVFSPGFILISREYIQKVKRLTDFLASSFLFLIFFPVVIITAIAIRLESSGPVFFRQERMGMGNKSFILWKFRSMYQNAEENGAVWAEKNDSRVTRVGKWIREFRIDEIPQLINVMKGEMSLIGPRPERPEFVKDLEKEIPYYSIRHAVRPGITGWAQINYRYGASFKDAAVKLEYDLYYIKNMSLLMDLKILLRTVGVVLFRDGAR